VNEKEIINDKEVASIKLECSSELCKKKGDVPFSEKTFEDAKEIKLFVKAINKAEKMNGKLDYGALFIMQVSLKNSK
jgi:hypothetical protein